ncbi:MAG: TonB-dependent receptor [Nocardioides sp.]
MSIQRVSHAALAAALFLTCTPHALADEADETIIVTGQSLEQTLPQELSRYGHDIEIVDEKTIKARAPLDVVAALQSVPGLYVRSQSGPFSYADISLQGSRTQDVLWTLDGIRLNNRLYGTTSPNDTLPASMIERIEVLKGGESLFYGTQAAAGMINVVTRSFTDELGGQLNASIDSRASNTVDGFIRGALGDHRFVAYASHIQSDGYRNYSVSQPSLTDKKYGYDIWMAGLKYQYQLAPDLVLNAQWQHTDAKLDNLAPSRVNKSRNDRNEEIASLRLDYTADDGVQFFLKGYFHDWKTAYVQILNPIPAGPPITVYPEGTFWGYRDWGGQAVVKLHPHRGLEYLLGYDLQKFNGRDDVLLIAPTFETVHAGIFQVRTNDELSSKGRLAAGLRYNKTVAGRQKTIWNVSGRYGFSDAFYAEGNAGTSFILPDASSLYGNDPCCEIGNPNLKPEEALNFTASLGGRFALTENGVKWKVTYFNRRITDLIDTDYDNPAFPNGTYTNVKDRVRAKGVEIELDADLSGGWSAQASFTYARVRNEGSSIQRDRNPEQYAKGAISYAPDDRPFGGNVVVNWVGDAWSSPSGFGRRNYGNYALVDAGAFVYLDGASRHHRVALNVENLFDKEYATRGFGSGVSDQGVLDGSFSRFLFFYRGLPRTVRLSYGLAF